MQTTDHSVIKSWIETHQGRPAIIKPSGPAGETVGLRIDFPGPDDEALLSRTRPSQTVDWETFFKLFEEKQLAFEYDEKDYGYPVKIEYRFVKRV